MGVCPEIVEMASKHVERGSVSLTIKDLSVKTTVLEHFLQDG